MEIVLHYYTHKGLLSVIFMSHAPPQMPGSIQNLHVSYKSFRKLFAVVIQYILYILVYKQSHDPAAGDLVPFFQLRLEFVLKIVKEL